jgi:HEAT repeat protein
MKLTPIILTLALLASSAGASYVTDAVAQMPAANPAAEAALAAKIMGGGAPAVKELCGLLVPLGTEGKDDTKARYAVSAIVRFAGRPGGEEHRDTVAKGLADAISSTDDVELRTFLVNRLQEVGRDEVIPALAPLLADPKLAEHAALALEQIGTPAAAAALAKALPTASSSAKIAIVKSLGSLRSTEAAAEIHNSVTADEKPLRMTALWALANIGDPAVRDALGRAEKNTESARERSQLYAWSLLLIERLAQAGKTQEAGSYAMGLLDEAFPSNVRSAAAALLARIEGDASLARLLTLAAQGDVEVRTAALQAAVGIKSDKVTPALVSRLNTGDRPEVKAALLDALALRRDTAARLGVIESAKDKEPAVRLAAIRALVALGADQAIPVLIERIVSETDTTVSTPATEMLGRVRGDAPLAAVAAALETAPPKAKVALLEVLAARVASGQRDAVLKQTTDAEPPVRLAALKAMEKIATEADATVLIARASDATDAGEESAALRAAVAAASQSTDADRRIDPFLSALEKAKGAKRGAIERSLAKLGGQRALDAVLTDLKSDDATTKDGAVRALAEWQDAAAVAPLLDVAKNETHADRQITAVRGVAQVLRAAKSMPDPEKSSAYQQALSAAKRADDRKMILGALANERGQAFFDVAAATLDDPSLKAESALAVIKIAVPQAKAQQPGLTDEAVSAALKKAVPNCPDPTLKDQASRHLEKLKGK